MIRPNSQHFGTVRNCFMLQELFAWFWCFPKCLLRSSRSFEWLLMCGYFCLLTIDWRSVTSRYIKSFECESSSSTVQACSHFDHTSLLPSFNALDQSSNNCMVRIWINCGLGSRWGSTYSPVSLSNPGSYFYVMLILLCYARWRGWGEWIHDRCEIDN